MLNTCSIGRRWKSREGWSRPVLTGERGTLFPIPLLGWGLGLVLWWFSRWMARNAVSCGRNDDTGKAFDLLASVVRFPDRHDRNRGRFRCRPPVFRLAVLYWFCGGHGPGETPGPFPNPEAKAWHGDGTALERVWESSAPPHSTSEDLPVESLGGFPEGPLFVFPLGVPAGRKAPGNPLFCFVVPARRPEPVARSFPSGLSRCSASGLFHAPGDLECRGISGISGEPLALIRWLNRLKNYALFRTQTLRRIEQNHVSRQSNSPAGRRPKLA